MRRKSVGSRLKGGIIPACFLTTESKKSESVPACESIATLIAWLVGLKTLLLSAEDLIQLLDQFKELATFLL